MLPPRPVLLVALHTGPRNLKPHCCSRSRPLPFTLSSGAAGHRPPSPRPAGSRPYLITTRSVPASLFSSYLPPRHRTRYTTTVPDIVCFDPVDQEWWVIDVTVAWQTVYQGGPGEAAAA